MEHNNAMHGNEEIKQYLYSDEFLNLVNCTYNALEKVLTNMMEGNHG